MLPQPFCVELDMRLPFFDGKAANETPQEVETRFEERLLWRITHPDARLLEKVPAMAATYGSCRYARQDGNQSGKCLAILANTATRHDGHDLKWCRTDDEAGLDAFLSSLYTMLLLVGSREFWNERHKDATTWMAGMHAAGVEPDGQQE